MEYTEFGDTRNTKGKIEEGNYTKKKKSAKEEYRIYMSKMKKEVQRDKYFKKLEKDNMTEEKENEKILKKRNKRELYTIANEGDFLYGNNCDNGNIQKAKKVKKKPKKERVQW